MAQLKMPSSAKNTFKCQNVTPQTPTTNVISRTIESLMTLKMRWEREREREWKRDKWSRARETAIL